MDDNKIIELYWQRNESAIVESSRKYGKYCRTIAYNILASNEDTDECLNDTWHNAWCAMPPQKPARLQYFFACITRNLALDRYGYNRAKKRNTQLESAIDEFWECVPNTDMPVEDMLALKEIINRFLATLDKRTRIIFLRRYWYNCSVKEIANSLHLTDSYVNVILHRTRNKFKTYLITEGVCL